MNKKKNHLGAITEDRSRDLPPLTLSSRSILLASLNTPLVILTGSSLPTFNKARKGQLNQQTATS